MPVSPVRVSPVRRRHGVAVLLVLAIDSLVSGLFIPLSLLYLVSRSGASLSTVGVLLAVAGLLTLPVPLWVGRSVDRAGARSAALAAQVVQGAGSALYLAAGSAGMVLLAALTASLGQRIFWSSIWALVSELSGDDPDPRARDRWFARIAALRATGYGMGALVSGTVVATRSPALARWVVVADTGLLVLAAVLVAAAVPRPARSSPRGHPDGRVAGRAAGPGGYRRLWQDRPYLALIMVNTGFALCNVMLSVAFPPFVVRALPSLVWTVGPLLALNTVVQATAQTSVVRFVRHLPRHTSLGIAGALWAVWALSTAAALRAPAGLRATCLVAAVLCYSAAQLLHGPTSNALAADAAPADVRGRYLAGFQYSFALATVAAPVLFTTLSAVGSALPWLTLGAVAALAVPGTLLLAPHLPPAALTGSPGRVEP